MKSGQLMQAQEIFKLLKLYDCINQNKDDSSIFTNIFGSILESKPLTLIQFTCSTIDPQWLYSDNPEYYVSLDPTGNNLELDLPRYKEINATLIEAGIPLRNVIIIGNTDPYYIYSEQGKIYPNIRREELLLRWNKRWENYKLNLTVWLNKVYPELKFEVISWYEFEKETENNFSISFEQQFNQVLLQEDRYFDKKDYSWELAKLKTCFGKEQYFYNLNLPSEPVLMEWIKRKFTEYALQGLWIKLFFPKALLVQNEKPTMLRYKMYQPLIQKYFQSNLPNLYFYGIDNEGYQ